MIAEETPIHIQADPMTASGSTTTQQSSKAFLNRTLQPDQQAVRIIMQECGCEESRAITLLRVGELSILIDFEDPNANDGDLTSAKQK